MIYWIGGYFFVGFVVFVLHPGLRSSLGTQWREIRSKKGRVHLLAITFCTIILIWPIVAIVRMASTGIRQDKYTLLRQRLIAHGISLNDRDDLDFYVSFIKSPFTTAANEKGESISEEILDEITFCYLKIGLKHQDRGHSLLVISLANSQGIKNYQSGGVTALLEYIRGA